MKSKAKTKKKDVEERLRKRLSITIDPDHYEFIKKEGFNVSRFMDNAIYALKTNINYAPILITTGISPNPQKNDVEDGLVVIRTRELRRVKATS